MYCVIHCFKSAFCKYSHTQQLLLTHTKSLEFHCNNLPFFNTTKREPREQLSSTNAKPQVSLPCNLRAALRTASILRESSAQYVMKERDS